MRVKLSYLTPLLAAGAAAAAIGAAPIASAESTTPSSPAATDVSGSVCESPGNVEINDTPGAMDFQPYGEDGLLLGGYGGYGFHGGGFGGGHGGGGHGGR